MRTGIPVLITALVSANGYTQQTDSSDTKHRPKLFFKLNSRRSFVAGERISIRGLRLGLAFNKKHRYGFGYFDSGLLGLDGGADVQLTDPSISSLPLNVNIELGYFALFYEYLFLKDSKWNVSFDTQWGVGRARKTFRDADEIVVERKRLTKYLGEATFELKYSIFKWLRASAGLGYRFILFSDDQLVKDSFNSPIYVLKVRISISYLFKKIVLKREE